MFRHTRTNQVRTRIFITASTPYTFPSLTSHRERGRLSMCRGNEYVQRTRKISSTFSELLAGVILPPTEYDHAHLTNLGNDLLTGVNSDNRNVR